MSLKDPDHPVWGILKLSIVMGSLVAILSFNSSCFDMTELKSLAEFALVYMGAEGVVGYRRWKNGRK